MSSTSCRRLFVLTLTVVIAASIAASTSWAAALSWNSAGGGAAATAANWTPAQVPTSADDLTFNLNAIYSVSWSAVVNASRTHTFRNGHVSNSVSSPHTMSLGMTIGDLAGDSAQVTLSTGSLTSNANVVIGDANGSSGTLNIVDDTADFIVGSGADLIVGNGGAGNLSITGVGFVQVADQLHVGSNSTSLASVNVSGFSLAPIGQSRLQVLGANDSRIGAGGDASMTISNGALASFASRLIVANGSASTSSVTVQTSGLLNARLDVGGELFLGRNVSGGIAAGDGTLIVNTGGLVTVSGATRLGDPDGGTGTITLGGGRIDNALPIEIGAGSVVEGFGTIDGDVNNQGAIHPQTATGLTFNGIISNTLVNGVVGTKIHFGATGGYVGSGTCQADLTADSGAVITATGSLVLGNSTTMGVSAHGELNVGTHIVSLVDTNGAVWGGIIDLAGGQVIAANGLGIENGGSLRGSGNVNGDFIVSGALDPDDPGVAGGLITVTGDLAMNPSATFQMDIGGTPASGNSDRVNVNGTASFDGTLVVHLKNGYVPKVGEQFIAINATAGRTGTMAAIVPPAPAPCNGVTFVMVYSSTAAIVLVRPPLGCTALGDLNSNGRHEGADIQLFCNSLIGGPYNSCADMNGDCTVSAADVPILLNALLQ